MEESSQRETEWALGDGPRFGLIDVDRPPFARTPNPSAEWLGRVARANSLDLSPRRYPAPVPMTVAEARARFHKPIKYGMVSAVAVVTGQTVLIFCSAVLDFEPVWANITSVMFGTIPSYLLNRAWVWGKRGSHHFWREVAPFWFIALLGLGFSTLLVHLVAQESDATIVVSLANLAAYGILWVAKYFFLDAVLFKIEDIVDPEEEDEPR